VKKRTRFALFSGVGVLVAVAAALWVWRSHDPVYQGKRLSAWTADLDGYAGPKMKGAQNAIHHIGAEAVPYVIGLLQARDTRFKGWINKLLSKQSWTKFRLNDATELRKRGLFACEALGTNARPAIPALTALLYDPKVCRHASFVLVGFGPEITPILTNAAAHPDPVIRWSSIASMARLDDSTTIPMLLRMMNDPDGQVRAFAAEVFGYVAKDPAIGIPPLLKALQDQDQRVQSAAAYRLQLWVQHPEARAAMPLLLEIIKKTATSPPSDSLAANANRNAAVTLKKLDPEAADRLSEPKD
jgi:HEAT repeat protein